MNWETIKYIYQCVLVRNNKIEYFGNDMYKIIRCDINSKIRWTTEYKNNKRHGKNIAWDKSGNKHFEEIYVDGVLKN